MSISGSWNKRKKDDKGVILGIRKKWSVDARR